MSIMDPWHYLDVPVDLDNPEDPHKHIKHGPNDSAALLVITFFDLELCYEATPHLEQVGNNAPSR